MLGDTGGGISRDDYIDKIATDVLGKLPAEFDMDKVRKKFGVDISPTTVVLLQELERFNKLITRMRISLATLKKVEKLTRILIFILVDHFKSDKELCTLTERMKNVIEWSGDKIVCSFHEFVQCMQPTPFRLI